MRVVHFSTSDWNEGAAVAAYRLHAAMCLYGVDSHMLVANRFLTDLSIWSVRPLDGLKMRLANWLHEGKVQGLDKRYAMRLDRTGINPLSYPIVRNSDVYLVHSTSGGFMGSKGLERLLDTGKPVYLFLHDLSPITGGCGCHLNCPSFVSGCTQCPAKGGSWVERAALKKQQLYLSYPNLYLVATSEWTRSQVSKAWLGAGLDAMVVPCVVDTKLFAPHQRLWSRWLFGLPKKSKCMLFVGGTQAPLKGWDLLCEALATVNLSEWTVVVLGDTTRSQQLPFRCKRVVNMGRVYDTATMAALYNAVDLTVVPSRAETFGLVAAESICCGTPVVAFDGSALLELIEEGVNGFLAKGSSLRGLAVQNLAEAIRKGMAHPLSDKERTEIAEAIASKVGYSAVVPPLIKKIESRQ